MFYNSLYWQLISLFVKGILENKNKANKLLWNEIHWSLILKYEYNGLQKVKMDNQFNLTQRNFLFKTLVSWIAPNQLLNIHVVTSMPGNPNQESTFGGNFTFWSSDTWLDWKLLLPFTFVWREWILSWQLAEGQLYKGEPFLKTKVCALAATKN